MEERLLELELVKAKEFLNIKDVALLTNLSISTIQRRIKSGSLEPIQKGFKHRKVFRKQDVMDWMNNGQ